jgi:hypothetical protein
MLFPSLGILKGWLGEINSNIGVKQSCLLSPTLFGIYIYKLEYYLEVVGWTYLTLATVVIIIILYSNDIVLMQKESL